MPVTCEHQELIGLRGESGVALNRERERERERERKRERKRDSFEGFAALIATSCEAIWQTHTHTHKKKTTFWCCNCKYYSHCLACLYCQAAFQKKKKRDNIYSEKSIWSLRIDQHLTCKLDRLSRGRAEM